MININNIIEDILQESKKDYFVQFVVYGAIERADKVFMSKYELVDEAEAMDEAESMDLIGAMYEAEDMYESEDMEDDEAMEDDEEMEEAMEFVELTAGELDELFYE